ncbi:unnamed protein product [Prorocentrum cordatum]|uniref:Uncharacterized protein n=1 Tax=Prorocentrum cordatum TaxID=2364126 RepID=A0ABN9UTD1_9DINO|nr:unnamed protein product [Polarella glacialis]
MPSVGRGSAGGRLGPAGGSASARGGGEVPHCLPAPRRGRLRLGEVPFLPAPRRGLRLEEVTWPARPQDGADGPCGVHTPAPGWCSSERTSSPRDRSISRHFGNGSARARRLSGIDQGGGTQQGVESECGGVDPMTQIVWETSSVIVFFSPSLVRFAAAPLFGMLF